MAAIRFVNEHQVVETAKGQSVREAALGVGINLNREFFRGLNCGGRGLCGLCKCWVKAQNGAVSAPNLRERLFGAAGGRRLACQVKVQGDIEVTSMPGGDDRLEADRKLAPVPPARSGSTEGSVAISKKDAAG